MKIVIGLKLANWNDTINANRRNKYMAAGAKKKEMQLISEFLKDVEPITEYPIHLICNWHIRNAISDLDNKSLKSVLDQMQVMGILENDNCKHITKIEYNFIKDEKDYLELEIIKG